MAIIQDIKKSEKDEAEKRDITINFNIINSISKTITYPEFEVQV